MTLGYRDALRLPGAVRFTTAAFAARLPIATIGLGLLLMVTTITGSYGRAGAISAAYTLSAALGSIVTSRVADRRGQRRVLPLLATVNALGLVGLVLTVRAGLPLIASLLAAMAAGSCQPAIGSMVRARWVHAAAQAGAPGLVRPAFALEGILDEVIFTVGPLLAATTSAAIGLGAPLIIAAVLVMGGGLGLAAQQSTQPTVHAHVQQGSALRQHGMLIVAGIAIGVGGVFGAYEVAVVAFCGSVGSEGMAGIVLALWAMGSALGGLWFGTRQWRRPLSSQIVLLTMLLTGVLVPAAIAPSLVFLVVVTALGGAVVAPTLITVFSTCERIVPARLLTEGLAVTTSALTVGFAGGIAIAGVLVDAVGPIGGFLLSIAAAALGLGVALAARGRLRSAVEGASSAPSGDPIVPIADDPVTGISPPRA